MDSHLTTVTQLMRICCTCIIVLVKTEVTRASEIHSLSTVLGRPVHQLANANIYSANHVAATKGVKTCRRGQFQFHNGEEMWSKLFLIVEWLLMSDKVIWVSQKRLISWDFHTHQSRVCREWCKKRNISSEQQFCRQKCSAPNWQLGWAGVEESVIVD